MVSFLFLLLIAFVNLAIGFALAVWLGHQPLRQLSLLVSTPVRNTTTPRRQQDEGPRRAEPEVATTPEPPAVEPQPAIDDLVKDLDEKLSELVATVDDVDQRLSPTAPRLSTPDMQQLAQRMDSPIQPVLRMLSQVSDFDEFETDQLEQHWMELNTLTVQLTTLSFGENNAESVRDQLSAICRNIVSQSRMTRETLEAVQTAVAC